MEQKEILIGILESDNIKEEIEQNEKFLFNLFPRLAYSKGFRHDDLKHHSDVWDHTKDTLEKSDKNVIVRLALLFHDIGKPFSYQEQDGIKSFKNHEKMSAHIAKEYLTEMGFSQNVVNKVERLVFNHGTKITLRQLDKEPEYVMDLVEVQRCNISSYNEKRNKTQLEYLSGVKQKLKKC